MKVVVTWIFKVQLCCQKIPSVHFKQIVMLFSIYLSGYNIDVYSVSSS